MVKKLCICLSAALMSALVYVPASCAQPKPIQEMHPKAFGRDFNEKDAAEYLKMVELLNSVDWDWDGRAVRLVDTAGLRRRARVEAGLEKLSVLLFGGEPLLNPLGSRELLVRAADCGMTSAWMISNGTLMTPRVARQLSDAGLTQV